MLLPALFYLLGLGMSGEGRFGFGEARVSILLVTTGAFTAVPLVMFGAAAQLVQLSTLGFIQYIAPTLQFLIGFFVYGEAFSMEKLVGYGMIWVSLAIYSGDGIVARERKDRGKPGKFLEI
jgi:chloramphenicol-sensitive protein RarD